MKSQLKGFTLVELLTVIGIISLLVGILVPALHIARLRAREASDRATLNSISMALETFRNDHGFYPPSHVRNEVIQGIFTIPTTLDIAWQPGLNPPDQGAHRLFEALMGLDTLGFQENYCYKTNAGDVPALPPGTPIAFNLNTKVWEGTKRWGPYIGMDNVEMGRMYEANDGGENFDVPDASGIPSSNNNWVFLDTIGLNNPKAILYYRARPSRKQHWDSGWNFNGKQLNPDDYDNLAIYNYKDNMWITQDTIFSSTIPLYPSFDEPVEFYNYTWDPMTGLDPANNNQPNIFHPSARPYNKDSFILINAGRDNQYGTKDDICNFQIRKN